MGFLNEGYGTLLSPLRRHCSSLKEKAEPEKRPLSARRPAEEDAGRDFDLVDTMERGLARELVADFMEPLPDADGLWQFTVDRSEDRTEYRLFCGNGDFLMYAKFERDSRRIDIHSYDPASASTPFDADRPVFSMAWNTELSEWSLYQDRCDNCRHCPRASVQCRFCRGHTELLRVRQSDAEIGDGINHCMEVRICSQSCEAHRAEAPHLVTKMPVWNPKVGCLVLDFKGRKVLASAKNFQLVADGGGPRRVVCQHGKLSASSFGLDFRFPLTVAQAFGLSLSTLFWV